MVMWWIRRRRMRIIKRETPRLQRQQQHRIYYISTASSHHNERDEVTIRQPLQLEASSSSFILNIIGRLLSLYIYTPLCTVLIFLLCVVLILYTMYLGSIHTGHGYTILYTTEEAKKIKSGEERRGGKKKRKAS